MTLFLIRAAVVAALSFSASLLFAQPKAAKSETFKDIIEKAYNLSLQRDRQQALTILSNAIHRESRSQAVMELKKTVAEIAHVFFSDKAQQLFEAGVALRKIDLNQAQDKISEAMRIEPDNFVITNELARVLIAKGDCRGAQEIAQKNLSLVSYDEESKLSLAQAYVCQGKWPEYQKVADPALIKKSPLQRFWYVLEVERHLAGKSLTKAQEAMVSLKKIDEKHPERSYWAWKIARSQKKENIEEAQKYLMTCKNISVNQYRQYMIDPMLCRHLSEVEQELKGINGTPE